MIPLVHVRTCTCPLKLLHGVTDSICSVRAAFSTGILSGGHIDPLVVWQLVLPCWQCTCGGQVLQY